MEELLAGKVAVVTGAGSAIGLACAKEMARHGAAVVVADIALDAVQAVADDIGADGGRARSGGRHRRGRPTGRG